MKGTFTLRRIFPQLKDADLLTIQNTASIMKVRKSQNLFIAGDSPRAIYAVANGCIKIIREGLEGETVITRIVRPGQILGLREVIGEFKYSRTAVALKDSEVFSIDSHSVSSMVQNYPSISIQFMKIFCNELARMEVRIESDLYHSAKSRVASVIYELHTLFADTPAEDNKIVFTPPLNRKDIAELADVTPETVSRVIADLRSSQIIETHGSAFHIQDINGLLIEAEDH
jgi:CRP-like cAMP-binding protein